LFHTKAQPGLRNYRTGWKNVAKDSCPENGTPLSPDNLKVDFQKTYYKSIMIGFDLLILCRVRKIKQTSEEKQKMMYTSKIAEEAMK